MGCAYSQHFYWFYILDLGYMWCDRAKSVWGRSNSVFIFLTNCNVHTIFTTLQKTPLKLINWSQRYEQLKNAKNNRKQKTFSALFGSILKSIFPTSDWFCLITSHISFLSHKKVNDLAVLFKHFFHRFPGWVEGFTYRCGFLSSHGWPMHLPTCYENLLVW